MRPPLRFEDLHCVLWAVGEFSIHAHGILDVLFRHRDHLKGGERAFIALEALQGMSQGERFPAEEWPLRIGRGRGFLNIGDLPPAAQTRLDQTEPRCNWDIVLRIPDGFEIGGKTDSDERVWAYLAETGEIVTIDPIRRRGQLKRASILTAEQETLLAQHSNTRWAPAREFSEPYLRCLLWLVGEFAARKLILSRLLEQHAGEWRGQQRGVTALDVLYCLTDGERFDVSELLRRLDRGRAQLAFSDLPPEVRNEMNSALPGSAWGIIRLTANGYLASAGAGSPESGTVHVGWSGAVTLRLPLALEALPPGVRAKVATLIPAGRHAFACRVQSPPGTPRGYEISYFPLRGDMRRFGLDADGNVLPPFE